MKFGAEPPNYPDTGCERAKKIGYAGPCVSCEIPVCLEDNPYFRLDTYRHEQLVKNAVALQRKGMRAKQIAAELNVQRDWIYRILRRSYANA